MLGSMRNICRIAFWVVAAVSLQPAAFAATPQPGYPVPQIIGPTHPSAVVPGSLHFTLDVYGANFINGSVVNWNGSVRTTTFVSAHHLRAQVNAADVASPTAGFVTITTNSPNGSIKSSTYAQVLVHQPTATVSFGLPTSFSVLGDPVMKPVDVRNVNRLDLMMTGFLSFEDFANDGNGVFTPEPQFALDSQGSGDVGLGDFDGDGIIDAIYAAGYVAPFNFEVAFGHGDGQFSSGKKKFGSFAGLGGQLVVGDLNQDGIEDVIIQQGGQTSGVYLGNGDGTFRQFSTVGFNGGFAVAADFNNDGKLDLVTEGQRGVSKEVQVWIGNGDGTFQKPKTIAKPNGGSHLYVTDMNGDGNEDLVFDDPAGNVSIILGNGDGTFRKAKSYAPSGYNLLLGDFNSDGKVDVAQFGVGVFSVMLGNGDGTIGPPQTIPVDSLIGNNNAAGDFNADGLVDLSSHGIGVQIYLHQ